ncbi:DUF418 domain-containing protein [Paenibacillus cisolokensis]|uniref:DUF418 domain-containing protein n=1 Tax=Paenibacillus cisolokensis TaxID=1658519 RepID=UPI003D295D3A
MTDVRQQRITLIDSLRGFALLGIFLVNILFFTTSLQTISFGVDLWTGGYNEALGMLKDIFINSKFILIFSFLFGLGAVLLQNSCEAKGLSFRRVYARRLTALLVIGLIHGMLIWYGDVLTHYAILGFLLLLFIKRKPKTLLIWSLILQLIVPVLVVISSLASSGDPQFTTLSGEEMQQTALYYQAKDAAIYGAGDAGQILGQRLNDFIASIFNMILFYPQVLGLFLLGMYFGKRRFLHDVAGHRALFVRWAWIGGVLGLAAQLAMAWTELSFAMEAVMLFVGAPLMSLAYISLFALLYQNKRCQKVLRVFSYPGKMAFTNYLMQSVICGFIFYSYGLALYGTVDVGIQMLIALAVYAAQVIFSMLWLRLFPIGPLEYVWRLFTYWGKPVRKGAVSHQASIASDKDSSRANRA